MSQVTLLGRGPSWKECPFCTEELWGSATCLVTDGLRDKKYTKVFAFERINESHPPLLLEALAIAKERNIPVVSTWEYSTERFPLREIANEFRSSFFMPTMSYMIAYALYLKYDRLYIAGVDQGPNWAYQTGKPQIVFWLGVATGRKVDLRIGRSCLRWAYRFGLTELPEIFFEDYDISIGRHVGITNEN